MIIKTFVGRCAMAQMVVAAALAGSARASEPEGNDACAPVAAAMRDLDRSPSSGRARWKKRWIASWLAVAAVNALDMHSSMGHREANPLLRNREGRFSVGKGLALKGAIFGGFFTLQYAITRTNPEGSAYKPLTITNGIIAGGFGGVAAHNYSLPTPRLAPAAVVPAHLARQSE